MNIFFHWSVLLFTILITTITYVKMLENSNSVIKLKIILLCVVLIVDFFLNYGLSRFNNLPIKYVDIIKETFVSGLCVISSISIYYDLKNDNEKMDYYDALCITGITSLLIGIYYFINNIGLIEKIIDKKEEEQLNDNIKEEQLNDNIKEELLNDNINLNIENNKDNI